MDLTWFTETIPGALVAFSGGIAALIAAATKVSTAIEDWKRSKRAKSVPPIQAQPENPFGPVPQTDPALLAFFSLQNTAMLNARLTLDDLRKALDQAGQDQARLAAREAAANQLKDRLVFELECERQKVASLDVAKAALEQRIAALEAERADLEQRIPTPLRPPARR